MIQLKREEKPLPPPPPPGTFRNPCQFCKKVMIVMMMMMIVMITKTNMAMKIIDYSDHGNDMKNVGDNVSNDGLVK